MGRPKKSNVEVPKPTAHRRGQAPKQVQDAIERHRADEAVAAREEKIQMLKNSLYTTTRSICTELERELSQQFTPAFVKAMAEAGFHYAETVAKDVESFRKHAKRATATVDDVKLCTRRSKTLQRAVTSFAEQLAASRSDRTSRVAEAPPATAATSTTAATSAAAAASAAPVADVVLSDTDDKLLEVIDDDEFYDLV